jgi:hypothetical protein
MAFEEEITAFERRGAWAIGWWRAPIRDHAGEVRFDPDASGTRVTWTIRFRPLVPGTGWILRRVLERAPGVWPRSPRARPRVNRWTAALSSGAARVRRCARGRRGAALALVWPH